LKIPTLNGTSYILIIEKGTENIFSVPFFWRRTYQILDENVNLWGLAQTRIAPGAIGLGVSRFGSIDSPDSPGFALGWNH
jgi:hypothetical protein